MSEISAEERELMRHAAGLNQKGVRKPYRNYFATDEHPTWESLVSRGLAARRGPIKAYGGMYLYAITRPGFAALGVRNLSGLEPREIPDTPFVAAEIAAALNQEQPK